MDNLINDITEALNQCDNYLDIILTLQEYIDDISEKNNICVRCECYKELEEWDEIHSYGDSNALEHWSQYICPMCKEE